MPTDEKPLLPLATSPEFSNHLSSSAQHLPPTSPAAKLLAQASTPPSRGNNRRPFLSSNKKRFFALIVFYGILLAIWYRDVHVKAWKEAMTSIERWRATSPCLDGSGRICDAYGQPFDHPIPDKPANSSLSSHQPLSSLGWAADEVYHLGSPLFLSNPAVYLSTLEDFLRKHFPPADSNEDDPNSLISALRTFFPSGSDSERRLRYPSIPRTIWQTAPTRKYYDDKEDIVQTWSELNEGWDVRFHDNELADRWVRRRFDMMNPGDGLERRAPRRGRNRKLRKTHSIPPLMSSSSIPSPQSKEKKAGQERGVLVAWEKLETPAVLRSDFWRYLVLAVEGGVYADTDVECMKPVEEWGLEIEWEGIPFVAFSLTRYAILGC